MVNDLLMCLIMKWCVNVLTTLIWIVMKRLYSCNSYWAMMMIFIQGLDHITYIKLCWLIKTLKTFQKGLKLSTELTRVRSVPSHIGKVGSLMYSWDWRLQCMYQRGSQLYLLVLELCCPHRNTREWIDVGAMFYFLIQPWQVVRLLLVYSFFTTRV